MHFLYLGHKPDTIGAQDIMKQTLQIKYNLFSYFETLGPTITETSWFFNMITPFSLKTWLPFCFQ